MPHGGSPAARSGVSTTDHREGKAERDDGEVVLGFVASLDAETPPVLPPFELPIRSRRASSVFVATKT